MRNLLIVLLTAVLVFSCNLENRKFVEIHEFSKDGFDISVKWTVELIPNPDSSRENVARANYRGEIQIAAGENTPESTTAITLNWNKIALIFTDRFGNVVPVCPVYRDDFPTPSSRDFTLQAGEKKTIYGTCNFDKDLLEQIAEIRTEIGAG